MKQVNFLIKPASSLCNLRCRYCFYADVAENREVANLGIMSGETAEALILSAFRAAEPRSQVSFAFQGGEPAMAGLDYFRSFVALVDKHRPSRVGVTYSIQTNGITVDEEWADFFRAHRFLVGVSLDGDKGLHDLHRVDPKGRGTYDRVAGAVKLLQARGVEVNLLCVVTGSCARHPRKVYTALKSLGVRYLQFIPCLDPLEEERGGMPFSLKPKDYGSFLCGLFDAWYQDWEQGQYMSVRLFDDYVHLAMGLPAGTCSTSGSCGSYFVAEGDGSLYPCDFYVLDEWRLGKVGEAPLEELAGGDRAKEFLAEGERKPDACRDCKWFRLCSGGCKRDWHEEDGVLKNYLCAAFQRFFGYAGDRIAHIARLEAEARAEIR
jgi:uncharacterized protein